MQMVFSNMHGWRIKFKSLLLGHCVFTPHLPPTVLAATALILTSVHISNSAQNVELKKCSKFLD